LVKDDEYSAEQLGSIIQSDPALASQILRLAKSGLYAVPRTIASLDVAMVVLGMHAVKNIALSLTLTEVFHEYRGKEFDFDRLWRRSLTTA
jgi:two-component system cell cycle response regulator